MAQRTVKPPRGGKQLWPWPTGLERQGRAFLVSKELGTVHGIPGFVDLGCEGKSWLLDQSEWQGLPQGGGAPGDCVRVGLRGTRRWSPRVQGADSTWRCASSCARWQ